jgi:hypothetical protein
VTRILGVSGSLRAHSANTALLRAAAIVAPEDVRITLYEGLGALPHFNPDVEAVALPAPVAAWRALVGATHAHASLIEILTTMAANVIVAEPDLARALRSGVAALADAVELSSARPEPD